MATAQRKTTIDEAADQLKVSREKILINLQECAPDFASRKQKTLSQDEVACIIKALKK